MNPALEHLVLRIVDMPADYSVTASGPGERFKVGLESGNQRYGLLYLVLDNLGERIILLSVTHSGAVPHVVELQEEIVSNVPEPGYPAEPGRDAVESVAVNHNVGMFLLPEDVLAHETDVEELGRDNRVQEIIVVSGDVYDLGGVILHHFHYHTEECRMRRIPFVVRVVQLPTVDYVTVHYQPVAIDGAEELRHFPHLGMGSAEMHVRNDNCLVMGSFHIAMSSGRSIRRIILDLLFVSGWAYKQIASATGYHIILQSLDNHLSTFLDMHNAALAVD